jgi:hypothetical protein
VLLPAQFVERWHRDMVPRSTDSPKRSSNAQSRQAARDSSRPRSGIRTSRKRAGNKGVERNVEPVTCCAVVT